MRETTVTLCQREIKSVWSSRKKIVEANDKGEGYNAISKQLIVSRTLVRCIMQGEKFCKKQTWSRAFAEDFKNPGKEISQRCQQGAPKIS